MSVPPLCIAPMIQWSDRYWRYLMRKITRDTVLYTEMTMDSALNWNKQNLEPFLGHDLSEYPLALQLGGCDPKSMGEAAYLAESYGAYESINVNAGCPSNRAKKCGFGAELMLEPVLVTRIVHEMKRMVTRTDVTVKCRLGVTNRESWEELIEFIRAVSDGGVRHIIVHARTCVLSGLSPAQNRTIPPLRHDDVHRLVEVFPEMKFTINGGIKTFEEAREHLNWPSSYPSSSSSSSSQILQGQKGSDISLLYNSSANKRMRLNESDVSASNGRGSGIEGGRWASNAVHGVMIGREAYRNPWLFSTADREFFNTSSSSSFHASSFPSSSSPSSSSSSSFFPDNDKEEVCIVPKGMPATRREVLEEYISYAARCQDSKTYGSNLCNIMKPLHNFFCGCPDNGQQLYKRKLDDLLKVHTKNVKNNVVSSFLSNSVSQSAFEGIVWEAVRDSVPDRFLDCDFRSMSLQQGSCGTNNSRDD